MVDRIREILNARHLSPTQFADTIGVARPIVSHILSGRNKPSLEVVQKIVAAFPDLSLPWLLSGIGAMEASVAPVAAAPPPTTRRLAPKTPETPLPAPEKPVPGEMNPGEAAKPAEAPSSATTQPATTLAGQEATTNALPPISEPLMAPYAAAGGANTTTAMKPGDTLPPAAFAPYPAMGTSITSAPAIEANAVRASLPATAAMDAAQLFAEPNKAIRRIVIFYQDGTFADYQPERN